MTEPAPVPERPWPAPWPGVEDMPFMTERQAVDAEHWHRIAHFLRHPRPTVAGSPFWRQAEANAQADVCDWRAWALDRCWADAAAMVRLMELRATGHRLDAALLHAVGRP